MPSPRRDRVFCLEESVWQEQAGLTDRTSVLATLELLERMRVLDMFVHRHAVAASEFETYLKWRAKDRRVRGYGTLYLAFHGTREGLCVSDDSYSLDRLAELLGNIPGAFVHLGSCSVLRGNDEAAKRFLNETGARMLSGYAEDVSWLDSAAIDTAWLGYVASYERLGDAERFFRKRYASALRYLKWDAISA